MRAHGKGLEGSEKREGGGWCKKRGCKKKRDARSTDTHPVYATVYTSYPWQEAGPNSEDDAE